MHIPVKGEPLGPAAYRRYVAALVQFHLAAADTVGLTATDYQASSLLDIDGPMTNTQLAEQLGLSRSATSRVVDRLAAEGLARRRVSPTDRRSVLIVHTGRLPDGLEQILTSVREPIASVVDSLSAEQRRGLSSYLSAATAAYRAAAAEIRSTGSPGGHPTDGPR